MAGRFQATRHNRRNLPLQPPHGPTQFGSTVVRPYYREEGDNNGAIQTGIDMQIPSDDPLLDNSDILPPPPPTIKRGRGCPKGSKNKPKRLNGHLDDAIDDALTNGDYLTMSFVNAKEQADIALTINFVPRVESPLPVSHLNYHR